MNLVITLIQALISVLLMSVILLQAKGSGLGTAFGGGSQFYSSKRGMEKALFVFTIILSGLFFFIAIVNFIVF